MVRSLLVGDDTSYGSNPGVKRWIVSGVSHISAYLFTEDWNAEKEVAREVDL